MTSRVLRAALVPAALVACAGAALAADYREPAPRSRLGYVERAARIGPACSDDWHIGGNLLRCPPQVQVVPADDDILAWNDIASIERQRRPYNELFSWSY